jgi:hypothetical protein
MFCPKVETGKVQKNALRERFGNVGQVANLRAD